MVTANNYMFRPLNGLSSGCTSNEKGLGGCTIYNVTSLCTLYIVQSPNPFSLDVQPDDSLLEAETCSC